MSTTTRDQSAFLADLTAKTLDTMTLAADANQRVLQEWVDLAAGTSREGLRLFGELQQHALQAARDGQALSQRWQSAWTTGPVEPATWYRQAMTEGVEGTQKAFHYAEAQAQTWLRSTERVQAQTEQCARNVQETLTTFAEKVKAAYVRA